MRWPGRIAPGSTYAKPVAHVDIFATSAAVAGASVPTDRLIDGVNLMPYIAGTNPGRPHQTLFFRSGPYATLLDGDWKLQVMDKPYSKIWLYNLGNDPTEWHNLAATDKIETASMLKELRGISATQAKPLWPSLLLGPVTIDHPLSYPEHPSDEVIFWAN